MKTIFWNVDTQFDFMKVHGKLYVPDAESIEPNLEKLTATAKENEIPVVNTGDSHSRGSQELSDEPDYVTTFPLHCMIKSLGANYIAATAPEDPYVADWRTSLDEEAVLSHRNIVLTKDDFDVFHPERGSPHANRVVELLEPDRAIVYGVASNVCVDFAVKGLLERGIEVYVVEDAIKGLPGLESPLEKWVASGVNLIQTDEAEQYVR